MAKDDTDTTQTGWTVWLLISCLTVAASSSFGFGYGIGAPNQFNEYIDNTIKGCGVNSSFTPTNKTTSEDFVDKLVDGLPQTLFTVANAVGAFTGTKWYAIAKLHSRRKLFYANHPFLFISVFLVLISYQTKLYWMYLISRIFQGYHGGMACAIVPTYINEIASRRVRGSAGTIHQLFITIGILASQIVGMPEILGTDTTWQWGFFVGSLTSFIAMFVNHFIPESPTECVATFHDDDAAEKSLRKLRDSVHVGGEIMTIKEQSGRTDETSTQRTTLSMQQLFRSRRLRWPLLISMTLLGGQALSGINAVFYYSGDIFREAGVSTQHMPYAIVLTGLINVIATIVAVKLMEATGRRALIIYPGIVMSATCLLLTVLMKVNSSGAGSKANAMVIVVLILLYVICFAVGMGPIPFLYCTEVFRHEARDSALVMGLLLNYFFNTILSLTFPALVKLIGGYVFLIFAVILAAQITLFWFKMPETKNKPIEDIEAFWNIKSASIPLNTLT